MARDSLRAWVAELVETEMAPATIRARPVRRFAPHYARTPSAVKRLTAVAADHRSRGEVNSVRILPDGRMVTASDDGTTVVSGCGTCGDYGVVISAARTRLAARANGMTAPLVTTTAERTS